MSKKDFLFFMFAWPFLGAFAAVIIGIMFRVGNASLGIMIFLGIISGYIALATYTYGLKSYKDEENGL